LWYYFRRNVIIVHSLRAKSAASFF